MSNQTMAAEAAHREQEQPLTEQRKGRRQTYSCPQLVAPYDGVRLPEQDEFGWAMFKDVSTTGISFLAETKPATRQLVVAVGHAPFTFLVVEIVRTSRRDDLKNRPYHVGCRILRELND